MIPGPELIRQFEDELRKTWKIHWRFAIILRHQHQLLPGSNIVIPSGSESLQDTFLYLLVSHSAPIVRAQDKGARIFGVGVVLLLGY